jgi:dTDP-4-dehydrorhamnose 3,5-epimerase
MISGVKIKKLKVLQDERGALFEILRSDDEIFKKFGQAYISICKPRWVKGWHYHKKQTDNFCLVKGKGRVVLYDGRQDSPTFGEVAEYDMGRNNLVVVSIPPLVVHGIENLGDEDCWLLNIPTHPYNYAKPDEYRFSLDDASIPYKKWRERKGW